MRDGREAYRPADPNYVSEQELMEREERKRLYMKNSYRVLKQDAQVALRMQQALLNEFYEQDMKMAYIQERRAEFRNKLHQRREQRQAMEQSLQLDIPNFTQRSRINALKERAHLTESTNVVSNPNMLEYSMQTTKRNTMNPQYDEAFTSYITNNKETLLNRHLHRDRGRQFHALQTLKRQTMEEDIGTPFIREKQRKFYESMRDTQYEQDKQQGIIGDEKEIEEAFAEIDRFDQQNQSYFSD